MVLYQKIFGLLYLQPYYFFKLLTNPKFADGEKAFKLVKDLYLRTAGSSRKNLTYLMSFCLMLLEKDKQEIVNQSLEATVLELYSIKFYGIIINSNNMLTEYFDDMKKFLLTEIIEYAKTRDIRLKGDSFYGNIHRDSLRGHDFAASQGEFQEETEAMNALKRDAFLKVL